METLKETFEEFRKKCEQVKVKQEELDKAVKELNELEKGVKKWQMKKLSENLILQWVC